MVMNVSFVRIIVLTAACIILFGCNNDRNVYLSLPLQEIVVNDGKGMSQEYVMPLNGHEDARWWGLYMLSNSNIENNASSVQIEIICKSKDERPILCTDFTDQASYRKSQKYDVVITNTPVVVFKGTLVELTKTFRKFVPKGHNGKGADLCITVSIDIGTNNVSILKDIYISGMKPDTKSEALFGDSIW